MKELLRLFAEVKSEDDNKEIEDVISKSFKAKNNIESVIRVLKDFVNFDEEIRKIQENLNEEDCDIVTMYKKIKIMIAIKEKLESSNDLTFEQKKEFREKFGNIDSAYLAFQNKIFEFIGLIPKALAKTQPSMIVKIFRILENEDVLEKALLEKIQGKQQKELKKGQKSNPFEEIQKKYDDQL